MRILPVYNSGYQKSRSVAFGEIDDISDIKTCYSSSPRVNGPANQSADNITTNKICTSVENCALKKICKKTVITAIGNIK